MDKKKVILSFDYELFFGEKSGSVKKTLIEPTNMLLDVMERCDLRGNFFIDYLMFKKMEELDSKVVKEDLILLRYQIEDILKRGHRIELHIHPHWLDAKYCEDGSWDFSDFTHYSMSSLSEDTIINLFMEGSSYLNNLAKSIDPEYKVCAFRAGGWAIQPFSTFREAFLSAGIYIDSSTAHGLRRKLTHSYYNFLNIPNKSFYRFEHDVNIECPHGSFLEIPITTFHMPFSDYLRERAKRRNGDYYKSFADGTHYRRDESPEKKNIITRFVEKIKKSYVEMLDFSFLLPKTIESYLINTQKDFYCFIDHPKDVDRGTLIGLNSIGSYCTSVLYVDLLNLLNDGYYEERNHQK